MRNEAPSVADAFSSGKKLDVDIPPSSPSSPRSCGAGIPAALVRAERRLGELMAGQKATIGVAKPPPPAGRNGRVAEKPDHMPPTLAEAGVDKSGTSPKSIRGPVSGHSYAREGADRHAVRAVHSSPWQGKGENHG